MAALVEEARLFEGADRLSRALTVLDDAALEIQGAAAIKRCEIAQMLYNLLGSANLL